MTVQRTDAVVHRHTPLAEGQPPNRILHVFKRLRRYPKLGSIAVSEQTNVSVLPGTCQIAITRHLDSEKWMTTIDLTQAVWGKSLGLRLHLELLKWTCRDLVANSQKASPTKIEQTTQIPVDLLFLTILKSDTGNNV